MEIRSRDEGDVTVLALSGAFETVDLPSLSRGVERLIDGEKHRLCFNFRDLSFINSTALGYLVEIGHRLKGLGGELVFSEPSRFFAATIRTLELHHIFEIFASDEDALAHLGSRTSGES